MRNYRRAKIVTVKRGYCWAIMGNSEDMDAQRADVFPNIAQMVFALRLQVRGPVFAAAAAAADAAA
jgi:hypothetical protein